MRRALVVTDAIVGALTMHDFGGGAAGMCPRVVGAAGDAVSVRPRSGSWLLVRMRSAARSAIMSVGRVSMAADGPRHHRGVPYPQPIQAADPQLTVHHRGIVAAQVPTVVCRLGMFSNERRQLRTIDLAGPGAMGAPT
jgi:hypothetical protein